MIERKQVEIYIPTHLLIEYPDPIYRTIREMTRDYTTYCGDGCWTSDEGDEFNESVTIVRAIVGDPNVPNRYLDAWIRDITSTLKELGEQVVLITVQLIYSTL